MNDDMLRPARLEIPSVPWQYDDTHAIVYDPRDGTQFDPANNADQFCDVLAWALANGINVRSDEVFWYPTIETVRAERISHDGTASGIRAAVVEAARRVVK